MDGKKFIEIKKPVEEVREIESEIKLETPKVEKVEEKKITSSPEEEELSEREKEFLEGIKDCHGVINTASLGAGSVPTKLLGKTIKGVGKLSDNKDLKIMGGVYDEASDRPGKGLGEAGKKVKEAFNE